MTKPTESPGPECGEIYGDSGSPTGYWCPSHDAWVVWEATA